MRRLVQRDFDAVFRTENPLHDDHNDIEGRNETKDVVGAKKVDFILCPTAPTPPPLLDDVKNAERRDPLDAYVNDVFTVPASLAGLPAVSIPAVRERDQGAASSAAVAVESNIGMQIIGQYGCDEGVLDLARKIEESLLLHQQQQR